MGRGIGLDNRHIRSLLSFVVAALLITSISYLGLRTFQASHAASGPAIYASPSSANVQQGTTLSVTMREDSGNVPVNSVQASMNYDSNSLQFVNITEGGAFPQVAASNTDTPGVIRIARANSDADVTGDKPIVTVNFKVIGASGQASIGFDSAYSFLVRSSDSKDILQNVSGGTFAIKSADPVVAPVTKPVIYINPASGSYNQGSTVSAAVRLNANSTSVTTIEAAIGYPANILQYTGVTEGGVFMTAQRTKAANGVIDVIRGVSGGSGGVTGDKPVVTLNFKVIGTGSAQLAMNGGSAAFDNSGTGNNILDLPGSAGSTYELVASGASGPSDTPSPAAGEADSKVKSTVTSPAQALTIATKSGTGHIAVTKGEDGSPLTDLSGEVELSPVIDPAMFGGNIGDAISKVEYYIDGKLISTQKTAPFTYKFDSKTMRNGTYTIVVKTYFKSGTADTRTDKLLVNNKVDLAYVMRNFIANIVAGIVILVLLVGVIWKLVIPRFNATAASASPTDHDAMYGFGSGSATGAVAADPTVIAPAGSPESAESLQPPVSSAALTTDALPMDTPAAPLPAQDNAYAAPEPIVIIPEASQSVPATTPTPPSTQTPSATSPVSTTQPEPAYPAQDRYVAPVVRPNYGDQPSTAAMPPAVAEQAVPKPQPTSIPVQIVDSPPTQAGSTTSMPPAASQISEPVPSPSTESGIPANKTYTS
jgi:hypothetical protein